MSETIRFLHCADLHIDSPLRGLERYEGAPVEDMRSATREAFKNVVGLAVDKKVDFLVIAGDIFDGDWKDYQTGVFFSSQLSRLGEQGIEVYIKRGNHDAQAKMTKTLPWPKNVHVFDELKAERVPNDNKGYAVHGRSFPTQHVTDDLAASYREPVPGFLNVAVLHTALEGREGHGTYAPTTKERLAAKGMQYWALGHVHAREEVLKKPCWIVFPGNTQGRHAKETGPKGCYIIEAEGDQIQSVDFHVIDAARWEQDIIDMTEVATESALGDRVAQTVKDKKGRVEGRPLAIRLTLAGSSHLYLSVGRESERMKNLIRTVVNDAGGGSVWLEKVHFDVTPPLNMEVLAAREDPVGYAVRELLATEKDKERAKALFANAMEGLNTKIHADSGPDLQALLRGDETVVQELVRRAGLKILAGLAATGVAE